MKNYSEILKNIKLFDSIDVKDYEKILSCLDAKVKTFKKNETIFSEGTHAKYLGIVLSGCIQINKDDFYGNRSIVTEIPQGNIFAEAFACADLKSLPVNVIAKTDSEVMLIECSKIIHTCEKSCSFHNTLIYNLLHVVAQKNIILNQKIEIISKRTTREKIMTYLLSQAKRSNSNSFFIPFDRQGLADYLGVERSAMSVEISKLRDEGILETNKSQFKLL